MGWCGKEVKGRPTNSFEDDAALPAIDTAFKNCRAVNARLCEWRSARRKKGRKGCHFDDILCAQLKKKNRVKASDRLTVSVLLL